MLYFSLTHFDFFKNAKQSDIILLRQKTGKVEEMLGFCHGPLTRHSGPH